MPKISLLEYGAKYIENMMKYAKEIGTDTPMGKACLLRAVYVMDFVEAWKEFCNK